MMLINGIHYHVEVDGSGAPLVLLHGFTGSSENWREIRPALNKRFTTVTFDLLGHGQTDAPDDPQRYAMAAAANDLAAIFGRLELPRVHLLGYSMGGRLALYVAHHYPERINSLVLESASPGLATEAERAARVESDERLARMIEAEGMTAFAAYWTNLPMFATQSDDLRQRLHQQRLRNNPRGLANSLRGMGTGVQPSLWGQLGQMTCPALLIVGERDAKFVEIARQMEQQIPTAETVIVAGAGHAVHAEQPEIYAQSVLDFLSSYN
jgi:2-succinyl-6-hydroxy-2,4-cyclohexadiene-1-carboxylate synthase